MRKLAASLLALLVVLVAVRWWFGGGERATDATPTSAPSAPSAASPRAGLVVDAGAEARRAVEGEAAETEPAELNGPVAPAEALDTRLVPSSSLGLTLTRVFYRAEGGVERELALDADGACVVPLVPPFELRASGHRELAIVAPGDARLEPVLGIVLRAPKLRERTVEAQLFWEPVGDAPEYGDWVLVGFPDADSFAIALDHRGRRDPSRNGQFAHIDLVTDDHRGIFVNPSERVMGTFEHALELDDSEPSRLIVSADAVCPKACDVALERTWHLQRQDEPRSNSAANAPWGRLRVQFDWDPLRAVEASKPEFSGVPGRTYCVAIRCPSCGSYGRRFVVAEPGEQRVDVPLDQPGTVVLARIDRSRWDEVRVMREVAEAPGHVLDFGVGWGWFGDGVYSLDGDGDVRVVLPARVPLLETSLWPMPPVAKLTFRVAGAGELERWTELPPGETIDLGALDFDPATAVAVLASGHGVDDPAYVGIAVNGETAVLNVESHQQRPSGERALFFVGRIEERLGRPFEANPLPSHMLVAAGDGSLHPFELDRELGGDRYVALPTTRETVRVSVGPNGLLGDPRSLRVGAVWRGLEVQFNQSFALPRPGRPVEWTFEWPDGASGIWWSEWGAPDAERRRAPMSSGDATLELR